MYVCVYIGERGTRSAEAAASVFTLVGAELDERPKKKKERERERERDR